jgi:hypothetical protein
MTDKDSIIYIRVTPDIKKRFKDLADREMISVSAYCRRLLAEYLRKEKNKEE